MDKNATVIVAAARTPLGGFQGTLSTLTAAELGGAAISAALARSGLTADGVDEVLMGCVLPAGQGQAPARQAALAGGLPYAAGCTTVNKMCGSGMKAVMLANDLIRAGSARVVVAGGQESMSNAPYLLPKARAGLRMGHQQLLDHMFLDGLEDAYEPGRLMGTYAEDCAGHFHFSREQQDAFAIRSLQRALQASRDGLFSAEITPVTVTGRKGTTTVTSDEQPFNASVEKIPTLKPAFRQSGTVTAANSSSISDGAAALMLCSMAYASERGLTPLARIAGHATHAQQPALFTTAPVFAIRKLLQQLAWQADEVDLYEINEAFAVVAMAAIEELTLDPERVNVYGGACALGHPIGASGARILVTLLNALTQTGQQRGVASLCIGGGEATAVAIERL